MFVLKPICFRAGYTGLGAKASNLVCFDKASRREANIWMGKAHRAGRMRSY